MVGRRVFRLGAGIFVSVGASSLPQLAAEKGEYLTLSGWTLPADCLWSSIHHHEAMCFAQIECVQMTLDLGFAVSLSEEHHVECRSCSLRQNTKACIDLWLEDLPSSILRLRMRAQSSPTVLNQPRNLL